MVRPSEEIIFRGYARKEDDHWFAICIDLNIAAQGSNPDEAIEICGEMIVEYLNYVCQQFPKELDKYIPRPAPQEFMDEYNSIIMLNISKPERKKTSKRIWNYQTKPSQFIPCGA